jgi:hypothetical protein
VIFLMLCFFGLIKKNQYCQISNLDRSGFKASDQVQGQGAG